MMQENLEPRPPLTSGLFDVAASSAFAARDHEDPPGERRQRKSRRRIEVARGFQFRLQSFEASMEVAFALFAKFMHDQRQPAALVPEFERAGGDHQTSDHRRGRRGIETPPLCEEGTLDLRLGVVLQGEIPVVPEPRRSHLPDHADFSAAIDIGEGPIEKVDEFSNGIRLRRIRIAVLRSGRFHRSLVVSRHEEHRVVQGPLLVGGLGGHDRMLRPARPLHRYHS